MDVEDEEQLRGVARLNSPPRSAVKTARASDGWVTEVRQRECGERYVTESDNETRRRELTRGRGSNSWHSLRLVAVA